MIRFNSNNEYVARCLDDGFAIFECEPFRRIKSVTEIGAIAIASLVGSSKLSVLVPGITDNTMASPRQLMLYDTQQCQSMSDLVLDTQNGILNIEVNEHRLVVVTESELHVFELPTMAPLQYVKTAPNPRGVASLCPNVFSTAVLPSCCYLAFPTQLKSGDDCVMVHDVMDRNTTQVTVLVRPHKTAVTNLRFSSDGCKLATASAKGTVIRVWSMPQGVPLHSLRRGTSTATIYTMSFGGDDNSLIAVSSSSGTIHVFGCGEPYATTVAAFSAEKRSLFSVKVKDGTKFTACALTRDGTKLHVVGGPWAFTYIIEGHKSAKLLQENKLQ
jgi:autophagy-related protein 18